MDENLEQRAKQLVVDPSDEKPLASMISFVFSQQEGETMESFQCLFKYCIDNHPNHLALKLSKIIQSPSSVMGNAICLIYTLLLKTPLLEISAETLSELKHTALITLQQQISTSGFPLLSAIISLIAYNGFSLGEGWTDYLAYVDSLIDHPSYFKKGLWLVIGFPLNMPSEMIMPYFSKMEDKIFSYLHEDWTPHEVDISAVAFVSSFPLMIILGDYDISEKLFNRLKNSITELIKQGKQVVLQKGLNILTFYASKKLWLMNRSTLRFVRSIIDHMMADECIDKQTAEAIQRLADETLAASTALVNDQKLAQKGTDEEGR